MNDIFGIEFGIGDKVAYILDFITLRRGEIVLIDGDMVHVRDIEWKDKNFITHCQKDEVVVIESKNLEGNKSSYNF